MRLLISIRSVFVAIMLAVAVVAYAQEEDDAVMAPEAVINLGGCKGLTADVFKAMAKKALAKRKYQIEEETGNSVIGALKAYKVEIIMVSPERIVVRFKPGYSASKDQWLRNLKTDLLWEIFL